MEKNLWGNLDELIDEVKLPKDILDEQAEFLKESLGGLVRCRGVHTTIPDGWIEFYEQFNVESDFSFSFKLLSDYVKGYEYEICKLTYGIKMYPLAITVGTGIAEEVKEVFDLEDEDTIIVGDEQLLYSVLQRILSSREVHQVLRGLLSIAKKEKESQDCPF